MLLGLRIDEAFADFDPYRHKVITSTQFIRVLDTILRSSSSSSHIQHKEVVVVKALIGSAMILLLI